MHFSRVTLCATWPKGTKQNYHSCGRNLHQKLSIFSSVHEKYHKMPHKIPCSRNINQCRTIVLNVPHFSEILFFFENFKVIIHTPSGQNTKRDRELWFAAFKRRYLNLKENHLEKLVWLFIWPSECKDSNVTYKLHLSIKGYIIAVANTQNLTIKRISKITLPLTKRSIFDHVGKF